MIVDDLYSAILGCRGKYAASFAEDFSRAEVFRVPFRVCPLQFTGDGNGIIDWDVNPIPSGLLPVGPDRLLSAVYARMPYAKIIICSESREPGVLLLQLMIPEQRHEQILARSVNETPRCWISGVLIALGPRGVLHVVGAARFVVTDRHIVAFGGLDVENADKVSLQLGLYRSDVSREEILSAAEEETVRINAVIDSDASFSVTATANGMMQTIATTLGLLNCRNIETATVTPAAALQRARARNGRPPLFTFKVLNVRPLSRSQRNAAGVVASPLSRHWVRGHFKDYSDRGLFGRLRGLYWWHPHLAGSAKAGVVVKQYRVAGGGR